MIEWDNLLKSTIIGRVILQDKIPGTLVVQGNRRIITYGGEDDEGIVFKNRNRYSGCNRTIHLSEDLQLFSNVGVKNHRI